MDTLKTRFAYFLLGCIGLRTLLALWARRLGRGDPSGWLPVLGLAGIAVGCGFLLIWATGSRPTGAEVGGGRIWWDRLRPVHGGLWLLFGLWAAGALPKGRFPRSRAWLPLAADTALGLAAFLAHHHSAGSFAALA